MKVHMSLPVSDIEATTRFYEALFAVPPSKVKADYVKFEPDFVPLNISFHTAASGEPHASPHLGFELASAEELDGHHRRLSEAGLIRVARETGVCCYAEQDKFWVEDPDGHAWEFYHLLADTTQRNTPNPEPAGCCPS